MKYNFDYEDKYFYFIQYHICAGPLLVWAQDFHYTLLGLLTN